MSKKIHLVSLGCDKNLCDSEKLLAMAYDKGYEFTDEPETADCIVVNTCAFILDAQEESVNTILEMAGKKKKGALLYITGCLSERFGDEIKKEIPEVDFVIGNTELLGYLEREHITKRTVTTGGHYAFLKIAEGCDKHCTYCIIPALRGRYRSFPMEELITEAEGLAGEGVKELILVAQETTVYGKDLYGRKMLPELLRRLSEIEGIEWIRVMYMYPEEITDELLLAMSSLKKVLHYFDMPVQHSNDRVLKAMGRRTTGREILERIEKIREIMPDACLRTTLITGFPGETEDEHEEVLRFIEEALFDRLGVFCYSREDGTKAALLPDQLPDEEKERRRDRIMSLQQEIAFDLCEEHIGEEFTVIVEGRLPDEEGNIYVGRTYMDAPDVDGLIYFDAGKRDFMTGDMVRVRATDARDYDLYGELITG